MPKRRRLFQVVRSAFGASLSEVIFRMLPEKVLTVDAISRQIFVILRSFLNFFEFLCASQDLGICGLPKLGIRTIQKHGFGKRPTVLMGVQGSKIV